MSASLRAALAACVGKTLTTFALARIRVLQADSDLREEPPMFDNESDSAPERPWQTFDNLIASDPEKAVTTPITVATDVKLALAFLYVGLADLVNSVGKLPTVEPLAPLRGAPAREANIVRLLEAVTGRMKPHLRLDPLSRDLGYPAVYRQKLEGLVASKGYVDPGAETLARLYLDFLKSVAWHAGTLAYERGRLTLNRATLYSILAQLEALVPEDDAPVVRDVLGLVKLQVELWEREVAFAKEKAAKAKKAAAKALAAKKAPAAPKGPGPESGGEAKKAATSGGEAKKAATKGGVAKKALEPKAGAEADSAAQPSLSSPSSLVSSAEGRGPEPVGTSNPSGLQTAAGAVRRGLGAPKPGAPPQESSKRGGSAKSPAIASPSIVEMDYDFMLDQLHQSVDQRDLSATVWAPSRRTAARPSGVQNRDPGATEDHALDDGELLEKEDDEEGDDLFEDDDHESADSSQEDEDDK